MTQPSTFGALEETITEIRKKGHYDNCRKNSSEYVDWCAWIEGIKERLLTLSSVLSSSTVDAINNINYDADDWISVSAAIERIHVLSNLIEDDISNAELQQSHQGKTRLFETPTHSYLKKENIGNGGAGNVYRVEREDDKPFALKVLQKQFCNNDIKVKRFIKEAVFCAQNTDVPSVKIVDFGYIPDGDIKQPFYVMPLYESTLRKMMTTSNMERSTILEYLLALLGSLEKFYSDGNVHRDIKPENILFDKDSDRLILADFGIAHINEDIPGLTLQTSHEERVANFIYSAPEQKQAGGCFDHRTDQYAFGLIINELFTGEIPQGYDYERITDKSKEFSYLDPVVDKMISQNIDSRYDNVSLLLADIQAQKRIKGIEDGIDILEHCSREPFDISIVDKKWNDPYLVFELNAAPSREWVECFRSYSGASSIFTDGFCLDPICFSIVSDEIRIPNSHGNRDYLAKACDVMPGYVHWANETMKKRIEKEKQEALESLVREREREIKKQEDSADINSFLNTL